MVDRRDNIPPQVLVAAERLRSAYQELQQSQDLIAKDALRQRIVDILEESVITTIASEIQQLTSDKKRANKN
jgi:hypothetical protein